MSADTDNLAALHRESAMVNDLNGLRSFLVGVFYEIQRCATLDQAKTCAQMAVVMVAEYDAGMWRPSPGDDPADWRPRR